LATGSSGGGPKRKKGTIQPKKGDRNGGKAGREKKTKKMPTWVTGGGDHRFCRIGRENPKLTGDAGQTSERTRTDEEGPVVRKADERTTNQSEKGEKHIPYTLDHPFTVTKGNMESETKQGGREGRAKGATYNENRKKFSKEVYVKG